MQSCWGRCKCHARIYNWEPGSQPPRHGISVTHSTGVPSLRCCVPFWMLRFTGGADQSKGVQRIPRLISYLENLTGKERLKIEGIRQKNDYGNCPNTIFAAAKNKGSIPTGRRNNSSTCSEEESGNRVTAAFSGWRWWCPAAVFGKAVVWWRSFRKICWELHNFGFRAGE